MTIGLIALGAGVLAHIAAAFLAARFLERSSPGLLERSQHLGDGPDGRRLWEFTAGCGMVPKWVSLIGLLGALSFLVGVVLVVSSLF